MKWNSNQAAQNKLSIINTYETTSIATLETYYQKFFRFMIFHNQINADLNLPEEFISLGVLTMAKICCYFSKPQNLN